MIPKWAIGADVHITSSTLDTRDSQSASISNITSNGDGTAIIKLDSAIAAVLSEKETPGQGVEIFVTTRNIQITSDVEYEPEHDTGGAADTEGGYLQVSSFSLLLAHSHSLTRPHH